MKYLLIIIALSFTACKSYTTCEYTISSSNDSTGDITVRDQGTYEQEIDEGNCGVETKSEYEACIADILETSCDFSNILDVEGEFWYYELNCFD